MRKLSSRAFPHVLVLALFLGAAANLSAAPIIFAGSDPSVGPGGARPASDAAATTFDAAASLLGTQSLIDFESLAVGNFAFLSVAPGVTVTLAGTASSDDAGITNVTGSAILGYNTTAGGDQHLRIVPAFDILTTTATFSFAQPIDSFGAYFTGIGTVAGTIQLIFNDGSSQLLTIPGSPLGGVTFFGFTDAGASISSIAVTETRTGTDTRDIFGIDDVRFTTAAAVPEPGILTLLGLGFVGAVRARRRR